MIESLNGIKKVDVFNDIVSRLEDSKVAKVSDDVVSGMKNYYNTGLNNNDYRNRVTSLAQNLESLKPIDNEVNDVIYLSDFMERGIAIKSTLNSFKQIWVEYRLLYNEINYKEEKINELNDELKLEIKEKVTLEDNLDDDYKKLYTKVISFSKDVEGFNKRKIELNKQIVALEQKKNKLSKEYEELENAKKEFEKYKEEELKKIDKLKNEVSGKVLSLQNLIDNLDNILEKAS